MKNIMKEQIIQIFSKHSFEYGFFLSGITGEGEFIEFWNNGKPYELGFYKDHKKIGERIVFDSRDNIHRHSFFKDDVEYHMNDAKKLFPEGPWIKDSVLNAWL